MVKKVASLTAAALTPAAIRKIRESLHLTQVEAGELLGGGPRAFQKYESGIIMPAASTANLLRVLEADPKAIEALSGTKVKALEIQGLRPFEVSGEHIRALTERRFVLLLRRLLSAEAQASGIPRSSLHVASNLTAPDGGEDARIVWTGGPDHTEFLPTRATLFQLKAAAVSPGRAAADVLTKAKTLEPAIEKLLNDGGSYVMLCNRALTHKEIERREDAVRKAIREHGLTIASQQVLFRDADQIATWVNAHPPVATWLLEQTQPGLGGPFRTWSHWAGRHEHERIQYVDDPRVTEFRDRLRGDLSEPRGVVRLLGLSGVGKSRLALEVLGPTEEEDAAGISLSDLVLYVVEPDAGTITVKSSLQTLVDLGIRALVVVDRCTVETHQVLAGMAKRSSSKVSLLTIDHDLSGPRPTGTLILDKAPAAVTEGILNFVAQGLRNEDQRRLAQFTKGFPQLAAMIGEAWLQDIPVATAPDATLIERIVIGRSVLAPGQTIIIRAAMLASALASLGYRDNMEDELDEAADYSGGLSRDDLKSGLEDLRQRGVIQLRGRFATLEPRPIATALAERRWREWSPTTWDELLTTSTFAVRLARRLALLDLSDIAHEVVRHVCRLGGPLDNPDTLKIERHAEVISSLAEIDARTVADLLDRLLGPMSRDELLDITDRNRRQIIHALEKVVFLPDTFEEGANLMMALALAENETWGNNATGQFCGLFPVMLGATAADGNARIAMLDSALGSNDDRQLLLVAGALARGATLDHFSRIVGSESHGLRPAYQTWTPATMGDAADYIQACLDRLLNLAKRADAVGIKARQDLAAKFRSLAVHGFLDFVEKAVYEITAIQGRTWPEAVGSLGDSLVYDFTDLRSAERTRIAALMDHLAPDDFEGRIKMLVTEMPWDYPCNVALDLNVLEKLQREAVEQLVDDLLKQPLELKKSLKRISIGQQRKAMTFGTALAERAPNPNQWTLPVLMACRRAPEKKRNGDLVAGFFIGLASRAPKAFETFKRTAIKSPIFGRLIPYITLAAGITSDDVKLVRDGLASGILPIGSLHCWSMGGVLAKLRPDIVAPLFSDLLNGDADRWNVAVNLMGMYAHSDHSRLEQLRPQVRQLAETCDVRGSRSDTMANHHFQQLVTWLLKQGAGDSDARSVALSLARVLVAKAENDGFAGEHRLTPLIPIMLQDFPEVVWSLISKAIVDEPMQAWRFEFALSEGIFPDSKKKSALLNLPPDTLFAWCHTYPDVGPAFLAVTLPLLCDKDGDGNDLLHPIIARLIDEFGEREDVQKSIVRNIYSFGWTGSTADYYRQYLVPFDELSLHRKGEIRRWAKKVSNGLTLRIEADKQLNDEQDALWGN